MQEKNCIFQFIGGNPGHVETSGKNAIGFWGQEHGS